jgi:hypothetical protein
MFPAGEFGIVVGCLFHLPRGVQDFFEERDLLCFGREDEIGELVETMQLGDDLEGVTLPDQLTFDPVSGHSAYLVNQESLPFRRIPHLLRILRDERVEERVETVIVSPLRSQDPAESLRLLST